MELEKEIFQKKFESEYHKAMLNIVFTSSWINSFQIGFFKPYGISPQQYNVLRILRGQHPNPASVTLIQERMLDKMSNASRLVDKLKDKNLVERKECKQDRRQVDVAITDIGLKLLAELDEAMKTQFDRLKCISEGEVKELNRILDKMRG